LDAVHPECSCEKFTVSEFSPGPVLDAEVIISAVTSDHYVDTNGRVEPTLFDQRLSGGLSVDRMAYSSASDVKERGERLAEGNPKKRYRGHIVLSVGSIRSVVHESKRCFSVYDTGLAENNSHAEIAMTNVPAEKT